MKNTIVFILFCLIYIANGAAQKDHLLLTKQMEKDLISLVNAVEAHPDPFTHASESDFSARVGQIREAIQEKKSELEFYKLLAPLISMIKDGHSQLHPPDYWLENQQKKTGCAALRSVCIRCR